MPARTGLPTSTPWQIHVARWGQCTRCYYHQRRKHVCLVRAKVLPADVLFVGEGPGNSEDVDGQPFVGPAGMLLDRIVATALEDVNGRVDRPIDLALAFSNLVGCLPVDPETGDKAAAPDDDCIEACSPRLRQLVALVRPKLIVAVGNVARDWLEQGYRHSVKLPPGIPQVHIVHPSAILKAPTAGQRLMERRAVVVLANKLEDVFCATVT